MLVPLRLVCFEFGGLRLLDFAGDAIVVMRTALVVSADGGGGKLERSGSEGRTWARQRKHSPFPKKCGEGRGASDRYAPKTYRRLAAGPVIYTWFCVPHHLRP